MDCRTALIKLYNIRLQGIRDVRSWSEIISDEVLDKIYQTEKDLEKLVIEILGAPQVDSDFITNTLFDLADDNNTGTIKSVEEMVDCMLR